MVVLYNRSLSPWDTQKQFTRYKITGKSGSEKNMVTLAEKSQQSTAQHSSMEDGCTGKQGQTCFRGRMEVAVQTQEVPTFNAR